MSRSELVKIGVSVYVVPVDDPALCRAYDRDCIELLAAGEHLRCAAGIMAHGILIESEGKCPFIGD